MGNFESFSRMAPPRLLTQHDNKQKERPAHLGSVLAITCTSPAAIPVPIPAAPARCSTVSGAQPSLQPQPTQPYVICSPFFHPNKEEKPSFPPVSSNYYSKGLVACARWAKPQGQCAVHAGGCIGLIQVAVHWNYRSASSKLLLWGASNNLEKVYLKVQKIGI